MSKIQIIKNVMTSICRRDENNVYELPEAFCSQLTWGAVHEIEGLRYPTAKASNKIIFYGKHEGEREPPRRIVSDILFKGKIGNEIRNPLYLSSQWGYTGASTDTGMQSWINIIRNYERISGQIYLTPENEQRLMTPVKDKSSEVTSLSQSRVQNHGDNTVSSNNQNPNAYGDMISYKNYIVFGAPGTGKSHNLNEAVNHWFVDAEGKRFERVTFYPTYSYAQFVGTYKPVMRAKPNGAEGEEIAYEFVPGPFLRVLVKALNETPNADGKKKDWCLVVEEINRANAAAVFGDVFQLLDRDADGVSEYAIAASEDVKKYLDKVLTEAGRNALNELTGSIESLRIPANMYIWATMNSADQGVFPMDTAFKRRWEFDNIGIDDEANGECSNWTIEGKGYNWNEIRRYINGLLAEHDVNEDKFMGPYFIKANSNNVVSKKMFASKVLMYLWEDAGRMIRRNLFGNNIKTYSKLVETWEREDVGVKVFEQCNKKENLSADLKALYANWTMPPPAERNS